MQRLVFGHAPPHRRQIPDLATFAQHHRRFFQRRLAGRTDRRAMLHHRVGRRHQPQRLAAVPEVPARLLPTARAQALGLAPLPVAGRRFAAVVAVLGQPRLQPLDLGSQQLHPFAQGGVLGFQFGDPCFGRHVSTLHLLRKSA